MNKMMKKAIILATVATMAISTSAFASYTPSGSIIDQYDVKAGEQYALYFKNSDSNSRNIEVTDVYEKEGKFFGTNRAIQWIDTDTGETGESTLGAWGNAIPYEAGTTFIIREDINIILQ